jgi:hypothetical protein
MVRRPTADELSDPHINNLQINYQTQNSTFMDLNSNAVTLA